MPLLSHLAYSSNLNYYTIRKSIELKFIANCTKIYTLKWEEDVRETDIKFNSCVIILFYFHMVCFALEHLIYNSNGKKGKIEKEDMDRKS